MFVGFADIFVVKPVTSSMFRLRPSSVVDCVTGEIAPEGFQQDVAGLIGFVTENVRQQNLTEIVGLLEADRRKLKAAEWGRQNGIGFITKPPTNVLAKSRIQKLAQHKTVTEILSYVNNPNPRKQKPSFAPTVNLGAVDKQMCELYRDENQLVLVWKCWQNQYELTFDIPERYQDLNITKFALPIVSIEKGEVWFRFAFQEQPKPQPENGIKAGVDLGRVEPFVMAVMSKRGKPMAVRKATGRLKQANLKRQRLIQESNHIWAKEQQHVRLGNLSRAAVLFEERQRKRNKITRLGVFIAQKTGNEIGKHLRQHQVPLLQLENLAWLNSKGKKWNHAAQQAHIIHAAHRAGTVVKKINPKGTSQNCWDCETPITHNRRKRTVYCPNCRTTLDRDVNAAYNIALQVKQQKTYPAVKRTNGNNYRKPQVVPPKAAKSRFKKKTLTKSTT